MPQARHILAYKAKAAVLRTSGGDTFEPAPPTSEVVCVGERTTVLEAAVRMNDHRIGAVPVVDEHGRIVGMFSERDVLQRVVATERAPGETRVGDVMTTPVCTCNLGTRVDVIRNTMREKRIRHVPVVDNDRILGMLSIGDLNMLEVRVMRETVSYLEQYMYNA